MSDTLRYWPTGVYPTYAFIGGHSPHPYRDPSGHSYGTPAPVASPMTRANWQENECYLWGLDLFNAGFHWEAHEQWEALWWAVGREGEVASLSKLLIKIAAAAIKVRQGRSKGVSIHTHRALALLGQDWASALPAYGLSSEQLKATIQALLPKPDQAYATPIHDLSITLYKAPPAEREAR